ncbi:SMI1/KNR4 family protein [Candidatus Tisiphia endosymbiont of Dascillus cervinus]|uniref:SMI1/KNR4 family protein n=1 Tax=Candidatus Tisiphia endosymbiont of Dascillus cervinus TaxID=3066253 RepID=UPI00312CB8DD
MGKYDYLKKYINFDQFDGKRPYNWFEKIDVDEIKIAENRLNFSFPISLKEFWLEIGHGSLPNPANLKDDFIGVHNNHFFSPQQIADIMLLKEESDYILPEAVEYIEEGYIKDDDIIFFEVADMSSFLVMKPSSDKPDAIYDEIGNLIEEHFERFIWRLYHESPDYYLHVHPDYLK